MEKGELLSKSPVVSFSIMKVSYVKLVFIALYGKIKIEVEQTVVLLWMNQQGLLLSFKKPGPRVSDASPTVYRALLTPPTLGCCFSPPRLLYCVL